jgi:hypothetical protein
MHKCNECGREFALKWKLNRHVTDTHGALVACELCGKTFKTKTSLRRHQKHSCANGKNKGGTKKKGTNKRAPQSLEHGVRQPEVRMDSVSEVQALKKRKLVEEEIDSLFAEGELEVGLCTF